MTLRTNYSKQVINCGIASRARFCAATGKNAFSARKLSQRAMAERTTWQQRARRTSGPSHYQFGDATRMVLSGPWRQRAGRTEGPAHYQFGDVTRMVINWTFNLHSTATHQRRHSRFSEMK